jgi:DNA-binding MarR family transcriptional regulator
MRAELRSPGPRYEALIQLLQTADVVWNVSRGFFARWDLSPSQFNVLNLLRGNPCGLSQSELSRRLVMHRSNVTGLVDRLEKRGLVQRREAASDRRAYQVVLTRSGIRIVGEVLPGYYRGAERVWAHLGAEQIAELKAELRQAAANAERAACELSPGHREL